MILALGFAWLLWSLLVTVTLLPALPSRFWLLRVGDFFRIQSFWFGLLLSLWGGALIIWWEGGGYVIFFLISGFVIAAWHARFLWPFMPWHAESVPDASLDENSFRLLVVNVEMENTQKEGVVEVIRQANPDLLLLVEVDTSWCDALSSLQESYAVTAMKPLDNAYGMMLYSKFAWKEFTWETRVQDDIPSAHFRWDMAGNPILVHAVHPRPPAPGEGISSAPRDLELLLLAKEIADCDEPMLVLGDFNDVPWSRTIRRFRSLSGLLDPRHGRRLLSTFHARFAMFRWPLDMVFVSHHFRFLAMERHTLPGSDHFALQLDLVLPPFDMGLTKHAEAQMLADQKEEPPEAVGDELADLEHGKVD